MIKITGVNLMEQFKQIMITIGQVFVVIWEYIVSAATLISAWVGEFFMENIVPFMPTMLKFFSDKKMNIIMFCIVAGYILVINIISFFMFGNDKKKAKRKQYRISESRLMRVCFWGGAIGGIIGMSVFRHKTLKAKFRIFIPIFFVIQLVLHSFVLGFLGFWAFF